MRTGVEKHCTNTPPCHHRHWLLNFALIVNCIVSSLVHRTRRPHQIIERFLPLLPQSTYSFIFAWFNLHLWMQQWTVFIDSGVWTCDVCAVMFTNKSQPSRKCNSFCRIESCPQNMLGLAWFHNHHNFSAKTCWLLCRTLKRFILHGSHLLLLRKTSKMIYNYMM